MTIRNQFAVKTVVITLIAVGAGASLLVADDPGDLSATPFKPVAPLENLMEGQQMTFKGLKAAILDQKWDDAETHAWMLAELANVNRQHAKSPAYAELAGKMLTQCTDLAAAAGKKDDAAVRAQLSAVGATCTACHDQFRKKH